MTKSSSRIAALCVGLVALGALAGCSFFAEDELPTLAREQTDADTLPSNVAQGLRADDFEPAIDLESVRRVGELAGVSVYLAHGRSVAENCFVLISDDPESWAASCQESDELMTTMDPGIEARTTKDGAIPKDDGDGVNNVNKGPWVVLTQDVIVREVTR